jgi:hypothetical protein
MWWLQKKQLTFLTIQTEKGVDYEVRIMKK